MRDFTPITGVASVPNVRMMHAQTAAPVGIANVAGLVAQARANRGRLNDGTGGNGSAGHPADVTQRLNQAYHDALDPPGLKPRLSSPMAERMASTPAQFGAFVKSELATYEAVVKASSATLGERQGSGCTDCGPGPGADFRRWFVPCVSAWRCCCR